MDWEPDECLMRKELYGLVLSCSTSSLAGKRGPRLGAIAAAAATAVPAIVWVLASRMQG